MESESEGFSIINEGSLTVDNLPIDAVSVSIIDCRSTDWVPIWRQLFEMGYLNHLVVSNCEATDALADDIRPHHMTFADLRMPMARP